MKLKIGVYCQHVLGIGHFHRSLEICRALAKDHDVTLITGGPAVKAEFSPGMSHMQLPGLQMDADFSTLVACNLSEATLAEIKSERQKILYRWFAREKPDIFITELYPFGRKAFRFELDPVLEAIKTGKLSPCFCCSSVRDILVEKETGREKFEQRVVNTLNNFFNLVLVHSDPDLIKLESTFQRLSEITIPISYTGFISKTNDEKANDNNPNGLYAPNATRLIVASIGGGNVGHDFLHKLIESFRLVTLARNDVFLQIFCGPYCPEEEYQRLIDKSTAQIRVSRFTDDFPGWLQTAALSVSMGGYNTCMDVIRAGIPALIYPFAQNREQRMRVERLREKVPITLLSEEKLAPEILAKLILANIDQNHVHTTIQLDGAEETVRQIIKAYTLFVTSAEIAKP